MRINECLKLNARALNISRDDNEYDSFSVGLDVMEGRRSEGICSPFLFDYMNAFKSYSLCHRILGLSAF